MPANALCLAWQNSCRLCARSARLSAEERVSIFRASGAAWSLARFLGCTECTTLKIRFLLASHSIASLLFRLVQCIVVAVLEVQTSAWMSTLAVDIKTHRSRLRVAAFCTSGCFECTLRKPQTVATRSCDSSQWCPTDRPRLISPSASNS